MDCILKVYDEVNIKFDGLGIKTRRKLVKSVKFFLPHARHLPSYKLGRWDGTISFCTLGASSYLNLLDILLPIVQEDGYNNITIEDYRKEYSFDFPKINENYLADLGNIWPKGHTMEGKPIVLRDYQVDLINKFLEHKQCIQEAPTAAGKTIVTATLAKMIEPYGKTLCIVPNKNLVLQTEEDYKNLGLDVGVFYGERKEVNATHIIATWQSLDALERMCKKKKLDKNLLYTFTQDKIAVIVDECHTAKSDVLKKLLSGPFGHCPLRFGLTGTIPKQDYEGIALISMIGPVVSSIKAHELQEKGFMSSCNVNILQLQDSIIAKKYVEERNLLFNDSERMKYISKLIEEISKSGNTLILVSHISAGKLLHKNIKDSIFINGSTKLKDRKEHYDEVATSNNKIIIATYGVASVGINIPRIFNLVLFESGKSFIRVIQSIGRGIRKAKDKDHVEIYDICSTAKYSKKHLTERKKYYTEAKYPFNITSVDWKK